MNVLLVDDESSIRLTLGDALVDAGHTVTRCENLTKARAQLETQGFDAVVVDMNLPDGSGLTLLPLARERNTHAELLVITAHQSIETAIQATKQGADYLLKPFLNEEVLARLGKFEELRRLKAEVARLKDATSRIPLDKLAGSSTRMRELHELIDTVGPSDATVLIMGESGTGKELAARALHRNSPRAGKPLVKLSCAALPESLLEGELFGHEKGAFTDAKERRPGRFELADGGTIFLDDIDDMSLPTQVKLLRVLQEREFERVGGTKTVKVDVRVIVATKVDLSLLAQDGKFRDDLYFRLNVVTLRLPPLRERLEDIPALIRHFCRRHGGDRLYHVDPETLTEMAAYPWPGNVRELENAVLRAITMAGKAETLEKRHLLQAPAAMNGVSAANARQADQGRSMSLLSGMARQTSGNPSSTPTGTVEAVASPSASGTEPTFRTLKEVLSEAERAHIKRVLNFTQNNRSRAAEILGISRKNLWEKMKDFGDKSEP